MSKKKKTGEYKALERRLKELGFKQTARQRVKQKEEKESKFNKPLLTLTQMTDNFMRNGDPEDCSRLEWFDWNDILGSIGVPTQDELFEKIIEIRHNNC